LNLDIKGDILEIKEGVSDIKRELGKVEFYLKRLCKKEGIL